MSSNISYKIEFEGIDQQIAKVKELKNLLNDINQNNGIDRLNNYSRNSEGGRGGGRGGNNVVAPVGGAPISNAAGNVLGDVVGASALATTVKSTNTALKEMLEKNLIEIRKSGGLFTGNTSYEEISSLFKTNVKNSNWKINSSSYNGGLSEMSPEMQKKHDEGVANLQKKFKSEDNSINGLAKIFRSIVPEGGKLENVFKKLAPETFKLLDSFGKLGPEVAGVIIAIAMLKTAIKMLQEGIEQGAQAYRSGAAAGINNNTNTLINSSFAQLGMGSPDLTILRMMLNGDTKHDTNAILSGGQMGMLGKEGQQLLNMSEEFKEAMDDGENAAKEMASYARANNKLKMDEMGIGREWKTLLAGLAAALYPLEHVILNLIKYTLEFINDIVQALVWFEQVLHLVPKSGPDNKPQWPSSGGGGALVAPNSSLEKLGFIINGPSQDVSKNIATIAANTTKLVSLYTSHVPDGGHWEGKGKFRHWSHQSFPSLP